MLNACGGRNQGLRSKRQPCQFPPLNAMVVGNTNSNYAHTAVHFFGPLELEIMDALLMLARGHVVVSEANSKSKMPKVHKMHECIDCGLRFFSGQSLGGHKRAKYEGSITYKRKIVIEPESENDVENKTKFDDV